MDIRYKSFVPRSKSDHNFDQIMRNTSKYTQSSYANNYNYQSPDKVFSDRSPTGISTNRKRVNVVTFTPDESNELVAKSIGGVNNSDNSPSDSPNYEFTNSITPTLPTIINTNHNLDYNSEQDCQSVNTASKIMLAKRKAVKEQPIDRDESKRKFNPTFSLDPSIKRAVSPEILNPEPTEFKSVEKKQKINNTARFNFNQKASKAPKLNLTSLSSSSMKNSEENTKREMPKMKKLSANEDSLNQGRPIINIRKSKVSYNPRPWQNNIDDEYDDVYKLKPKNIVYGGHSREVSDDIYKSKSEMRRAYSASSNVGPQRVFDKSKSSLNEKHVPKISQLKSPHNSEPNTYPEVQNVKEAYECQETGETQHLLDDVDFLIDGLKGQVKPAAKTLSIISLIEKCLSKSFRDMLKAHGLVYKIFDYLSDATSDGSIAMTTAALFLVFARDRQPRVFKEQSLSMLLQLPYAIKTQSNKDYDRTRDKLRLVLAKLHQTSASTTITNPQNRSFHSSTNNAISQIMPVLPLKTSNINLTSLTFQRRCVCCKHLKLDNTITTEDIVVECLLQLRTRKTIDWYKDQMRKLRGIDLICEQIAASVEYLGYDLGPQCLDEFVLDRMYRLFNYTKFLEHMTISNRDNQSHLIDYKDGGLISNLCRCLKLCAANLSHQAAGSQEKKIIQDCLLAILRLFANISHDNEYASNQLGCCKGLIKLLFSCLLHLPRFTNARKRFDLSIVALAALINLVEHCSDNRMRMAHVTVSRKRVACLGKAGQFVKPEANNEGGEKLDEDEVKPVKKVGMVGEKMDFGFDDEQDEEDMDLEDDYEEDGSGMGGDCNSGDVAEEFSFTQFIDFDADSSNETRINILEALVKLFLRHDDRARNNTIIEGEEELSNGKPIKKLASNGLGETELEDEEDEEEEHDVDAEGNEEDLKWRLVIDNKSGGKRGQLGGKKTQLGGAKKKHNHTSDSEDDEDDDDEGSSDDGGGGADVEFLINNKEEEVELQKKLSAAGQHMQDSVVSAYTALLLGFIMKGSSSRFMERIREHLPEGKFRLLAFVLGKFLSIVSLTSAMGQSSGESMLEIVRLLEAQDKPPGTASETSNNNNMGGTMSTKPNTTSEMSYGSNTSKVTSSKYRDIDTYSDNNNAIENDGDDDDDDNDDDDNDHILSYSRYKRDYDIEDDDDDDDDDMSDDELDKTVH